MYLNYGMRQSRRWSRERVQQWTAEKIADVPQIQEDTVEVVKTAVEKGIFDRSKAVKVPKISRDTVLMPGKCRGWPGLAAHSEAASRHGA